MIEVKLSAIKEAKPNQYLLRFFFGGLCTVAAAVIAERFGPLIGGIFLAFPAIFPASASLIESGERDKKRQVGADGTIRGRLAASNDAIGASLGCVGLMIFAWVVWRRLTVHGVGSTIALGTVGWVFASCLLWMLRRKRFLR